MNFHRRTITILPPPPLLWWASPRRWRPITSSPTVLQHDPAALRSVFFTSATNCGTFPVSFREITSGWCYPQRLFIFRLLCCPQRRVGVSGRIPGTESSPSSLLPSSQQTGCFSLSLSHIWLRRLLRILKRTYRIEDNSTE